MKITQEEFVKELSSIYPNTQVIMRGGTCLPRVSQLAAEQCFIHKTENEFVDVLREYLLELSKKGWVDFI